MTGQLIYQELDVRLLNLDNNSYNSTFKNPYLTGRQAESKIYTKRIVGGHPTADWVNELPSKHTRVVVFFTDGSTLYFNDMRVFGWMKVVNREQWTADSRKLPPDVVDKEFTSNYLKTVIKRANKPIKLLLLDQYKIGGMGNIYTNDALWLSKVKPTRKANDLKGTEIKLLYNACKQVIERGIATGGASENTYRHINGLGGKYQEEFLVYKRDGESCLRHRCKGIIKKVGIGGRGTYYCPVCQK
jgi:formamidopyrimidine-DNA glycosylase